MSHYFESGFFVREKAWHGLGTVLQDAPSTRDAFIAAGLDWSVDLMPLYANVPGGQQLCEEHQAVVRMRHQRDGSIASDVLAVVGNRYKPLQNLDAFRWFDPLVADRDVSLEAAGSVKGGRHVWVLAKVNAKPEHVGRNAQDIVTPYLLLSNSHDGTRSITVAFTPIRVVCWNTLSAANRAADARGSNARKVRHTRHAEHTLQGIRETINLSVRDFSAKALLWREMGKRTFSGMTEAMRVTKDYTRAVFGEPTEVAKARRDKAELPEVRAERQMWDLFQAGPGASSAGQTPFGLYMAATHYLDHHRGHNADTRLATTWFSQGEQIRNRAESEAMALAGMA